MDASKCDAGRCQLGYGVSTVDGLCVGKTSHNSHWHAIYLTN